MQALMLKQLVTFHIGPIDLCIEQGQSIGIHGSSGAGKSLLLRAIADLDPHEGEVTLYGTSQSALSPSEWRGRVGYCAAESQWWGTKVIDHLPATLDEKGVRSWLNRFGFDVETLQWSIDRLSSGEKQRLSLLRQLVRNPEVLLLDEPTANLDPENRRRIEALLQQIQQQGTAMLWISHDQAQLRRVCERQYQMINGQLQPSEEEYRGRN